MHDQPRKQGKKELGGGGVSNQYRGEGEYSKIGGLGTLCQPGLILAI